ncbi:adenosylmethionine decarboxylase [Methylibium sp.]|uniref:adenosylmethionine decarboxylase n=1 Tax=Methylibium sp. TaxID=2067992 RepID=UPI003D0B2F69
MQGLHLTADLSGCRRGTPALIDVAALRTLCLRAVSDAGLQAVGECFHPFPSEQGEPRGVTGVLLLAESHLAVHTWPELDAVTLDIYVCHRHADNSARAEAVIAQLLDAFAPRHTERQALHRGAPP